MQILSPPLLSSVRNLCNSAKQELTIVSPWIKENALSKADLNSSSRRKLRVLTRGELQDFATGTSDLSAIQNLLAVEADIRLINNLHAKVYIADRTSAIITSANLTNWGMEANVELGVLLDSPENIRSLCASIDEYFRSGRRIDAEWVEAMEAAIGQSRTQADRRASVDHEIQSLGKELLGARFPVPRSKSEELDSSNLRPPDEWKQAAREWKYLSSDLTQAEQMLRVIERAFSCLPQQALPSAWFGVHRFYSSITVGGIWLFAIRARKPSDKVLSWVPTRNICMLVDRLWDLPAPSTQNHTPLGWRYFPWENTDELMGSNDVWDSFTQAGRKILDAPISRQGSHKHRASKWPVIDLV